MTSVLEENGIPHHPQFAYQAGLSCTDPTEVVQEAARSHIQHGSTVYQLQYFYDLERPLIYSSTAYSLTTYTDLV